MKVNYNIGHIAIAFFAFLLVGVILWAGWNEKKVVEKSREIWRQLDQSKIAAFCKESQPLLTQWGDNVFSVGAKGAPSQWREMSVNIDRVPSPGWYDLDPAEKGKILNVILYCYAEGAAIVYDWHLNRLAQLNLTSGSTLQAAKTEVAIYGPPPQPTISQNVVRCSKLAIESDWYSFYAQTVMRDDSDGAKLYLNGNWKRTPIYQKEKILEYAGSCRKTSYTTFYDGYSGVQLGRYYPVVGTSVTSE